MKKDYQGYLIDLDGTIYLGANSSRKTFCRAVTGKRFAFLFVTNHATKSPETVAATFSK